LGLAHGFFGEEGKEWYSKITDRDKMSKFLIPLGDVNGNPIAFALPKDEMNAAVGNMLFYTIDNIRSNEPEKAKPLKAAYNSLTSVFPSISPIVEELMNLANFAAGNNPMDFFYDRPVIPTKTFRGGTVGENVGEYSKHLGRKIAGNYIDLTYGHDVKRETENATDKALYKKTIGRFFRTYTAHDVIDRINRENEERNQNDIQSSKQERFFAEKARNLSSVQDLTPADIIDWMIDYKNSDVYREDKSPTSAFNSLRYNLVRKAGGKKVKLPSVRDVRLAFRDFERSGLNYRINSEGKRVQNFTEEAFSAKIYSIYYGINERHGGKVITVKDYEQMRRDRVITY
jgi:hypothetical protein